MAFARSRLGAGLLGLACVVAGCSKTPAAANAMPIGVAAQVSSFELNTLDLGGEIELLRGLSFKQTSERELGGAEFGALLGVPDARARQVVLALGEQRLELRQFLAPVGRPVPVARADDLGFEHIAIVVRDMDAAYAQLLQTHAQPISSAPQTLPADNPTAAGVRAEYFRDSDGHFMELIQFPPDKGDAAWRRKTLELFLGIDHSAITVKNSKNSLLFYRDALGLQLRTESLNEGREQAALSGVAGARVHIDALRGERGPGIELLEFLAPQGGKPFPEATTADSVHWEIALQVASVEAALRALQRAGFDVTRAHEANVSALFSDEIQAALVRDPDGHTVRLFEARP
jgi:catechol 2,3-dioxygenase-like lactoylglutathione lyase family enzyme